MRAVLLTLAAAALPFAAASQPAAPPPAPERSVVTTTSGDAALLGADIAIVLTAHADTVRFDGPPQASITLSASPGGQAAAAYDPGLLARVIQPTRVYRDVDVTLTGAARIDADGARTTVDADAATGSSRTCLPGRDCS